MQADYTLTRDQFITANYQLGARPRRFVTGLSAVFLLLLAAIFANNQPLATGITFFIIVIGAGAIGLFVVGPKRIKGRFGRIYDSIDSLHAPLHCTFDPEGITMQSSKGRLRLDFSKLHKIVETRDFILLYTAPATAQLLPKAALNEESLILVRKAPVPHSTP